MIAAGWVGAHGSNRGPRGWNASRRREFRVLGLFMMVCKKVHHWFRVLVAAMAVVTIGVAVLRMHNRL